MRQPSFLRLMLCQFILLAPSGFAQKPPPNPETVRLIDSIQGPALYHEYCAVCHGSAGKGDGPMATSLKASPRDLTRISTRGTFPLARIEKIISGDQSVSAGHGTKDMPVWGPVFSQIAWDQDLGRVRIHNLALYLRELQPK